MIPAEAMKKGLELAGKGYSRIAVWPCCQKNLRHRPKYRSAAATKTSSNHAEGDKIYT